MIKASPSSGRSPRGCVGGTRMGRGSVSSILSAMDSAPRRRFDLPIPSSGRFLAVGAAMLLLMLALAASARADSPATAYGQRLEEVELRLRFAIELAPAELNQDIAFTETLCATAESAEAAGEAPAARVDWQGLAQTVRRNDLGLARTIDSTLRAADRRVEGLGKAPAGSRGEQPAIARSLRGGVGDVRAGILHLQVGVQELRAGFGRFLRRDCQGAEAAIAAAARPIGRGLVRVDSGMGLLWLLDEPADRRA